MVTGLTTALYPMTGLIVVSLLVPGFSFSQYRTVCERRRGTFELSTQGWTPEEIWDLKLTMNEYEHNLYHLET